MGRFAPAWLPAPLREYANDIAEALGDPEPADVPGLVDGITAGHERDIERGSLVLYAGTNVMSPLARRALASGVGSLPSMGPPGEKYQTGTRWIERLEVLASMLARRVFDARFAEVRLHSGTLANLAVYAALTEPGDNIVVLPERAGGHTSHHAIGAPGIRGLRVVEMPFDAERMNVDVDGLRAVIERERPKLVVAGASLMLFPHPVAEMASAAHEGGARLLYDAAHVAGLIAGGRFQRPLADGADVMTCSTYKSFGGPPGALVVSNDPAVAEAIERAAYPGMTANYDASRLASLSIAQAEVLAFWREYAGRCVSNAQALAAAMSAHGIAVVGAAHGSTVSHHVVIDARSFGGGASAARQLEPANILASAIGLPWDEPDAPPSGVRLGTQAVTRWGLGPQEMERVAELIAAVLVYGGDADEVRADVRALRRTFDRVGFCFDPAAPRE
jgi:glycine hydroxymethyltransferase